jgi:hypothetical protein
MSNAEKVLHRHARVAREHLAATQAAQAAVQAQIAAHLHDGQPVEPVKPAEPAPPVAQ